MGKMTEELIFFLILWIFLLMPAFGSDQGPSGSDPKAAEQKNQPGSAGTPQTDRPSDVKTMTLPASEEKAMHEKIIGEDKGGSQGEPAPSEKTKDVTSEPGGKKAGDDQKAGGEEAKEKDKALKDKKTLKDQPPDRRWIIKQESGNKESPPKKKPVPVKWKNESQKTQCEAELEALKSRYRQTRYYSTQGDACSTAENAKAFLGLYETFNKECPEEFIRQSGFSQRMKGNVMKLQELGTKECLRGSAPPR